MRAVARLNADSGKALADPAIRANLVQSAQEPIGGTPEAFGARVREDFEKYGRLVQASCRHLAAPGSADSCCRGLTPHRLPAPPALQVREHLAVA